MPDLRINNRNVTVDQQLFKYTVAGCMQAVLDTFARTRRSVLTCKEAYDLHCDYTGPAAYAWNSWERAWADLRRVGIRKFSHQNNDLRIQYTSRIITLP